MEKSLKNYAFVDSQNLNLGIKGCDWNLDFAKFFVYLKDKYKIGKAFLFIGYVAGNEALYTFLQKAGYIVIFKPTLEYEPQTLGGVSNPAQRFVYFPAASGGVLKSLGYIFAFARKFKRASSLELPSLYLKIKRMEKYIQKAMLTLNLYYIR